MSDEVTFLWLDFETTGLDPQDDILEAAWQFTDQDLRAHGVGGHAYVRRDFFRFGITDPTVLRMHSDNGLLVDWSGGPWVTPRELENEILGQIRVDGFGTVQLAGSGVHFDKRLIEVWLPELHQALHYQIGVDVSQLGRFVEGVCGIELSTKPAVAHRAERDVGDAIARAREIRDVLIAFEEVSDDDA